MSEKYEFIDVEYAASLTARRLRADAPTLAADVRVAERVPLGVLRVAIPAGLGDGGPAGGVEGEDRGVVRAVDAVYGYRRIHAELVRDGEQVSPELVRKLMRQLELYPCQPRPYKTTTIRGRDEPAGADLIGRDFGADRPGCKLVGDITYIRTWDGWPYLATVIDCFNREVIGWTAADHMRTDLITDALAMAARNHTLEPGCIFHSDRGSQTPRPHSPTRSPVTGYADRCPAPGYVSTMPSPNRASRHSRTSEFTV